MRDCRVFGRKYGERAFKIHLLWHDECKAQRIGWNAGKKKWYIMEDVGEGIRKSARGKLYGEGEE